MGSWEGDYSTMAAISLNFWNPVVCLVVFLVVIALVYLLRNRGEGGYKKGTEQTKAFLCGEELPEVEDRHVKAHNIYWGFFQALKKYYGPTIKAHTGIVNDYVLWLTAITVIAAITFTLV